jgi:hypothetical protein
MTVVKPLVGVFGVQSFTMHGLLVPTIPDIPMTQIPIDDSLVGIFPDDSDIAISDFLEWKIS